MHSNVLFITENSNIFSEYEKIFEKHKINFELCTKKHEAVDNTAEKKYDLVLIHEDFIISHGQKTFRQIVYNSYMDNIPLVLIIDKGKIDDLSKYFDSGLSDFIKTNFTNQEICVKILSLIENKKKFMSLEQSLIISASLIDNLESHLLDIDKLKVQIESQNKVLENEMQKKHELYAGNLHDLKAPFSSLLGNTQLLLEGYIGKLTDGQLQSVKVIEKSARRLLELIEDYLDNSKYESGKINLYLNKVDVSFLIELAVKDLLVLIENKKLSLSTEIKSPTPQVHVDIDKIIRVIHNLIMNAIKNTPEGGKISISASQDLPDFVTITVKDTGVGISKENQKTIFNKYDQGGRNVSGSGLGLAICKDIISDLHYGEIWVESETGKGSEFSFTLPVEFKSVEAEPFE